MNCDQCKNPKDDGVYISVKMVYAICVNCAIKLRDKINYQIDAYNKSLSSSCNICNQFGHVGINCPGINSIHALKFI
jgi:hypothetical protein